MIKIRNKQMHHVAILENAYDVGYERGWNEIWSASFSLPLDDEKNDLCKPLNYVELYDNGEYVGLFRIIPKETVIDDNGNTVTYQCEHVLATLLDSSIFKYKQIDGYHTGFVIDFILGFQKEEHWKLGDLGVARLFSYKFENCNLLSALFSITQPIDEPYQWTWDTTVYPWRLNLVTPEMTPTCEIREGKNLRGLTLTEDPMGIYNRIYPLGYGEGDNQLTISIANNGIPYIEDSQSVAEYGVREYIWVDKRYEDATSLKFAALARLFSWRQPIASWDISAADLSAITGEDIDKLRMGKIVRLSVPTLKKSVDLRILKESKSDITGNPGDIQLELGNRVGDLGTSHTDMERRQQIQELYSQGATNMLSYSYNDNADADNPAEIVFFLPEEMVKINKLSLWFETDHFRTYQKAIGGGGATSVTSSAGGAVSATSSAGGGVSSTSSAGGGVSTSSAAGGDHDHLVFSYVGDDTSGISTPREFIPKGGYNFRVVIDADAPADLYTAGSSGNHTHTFQTQDHTHTFSTPNHVHTFQTENHTHNFQLMDHTHDIQWGIFKLPELPSKVTIKVDGTTVPYTSTEGEDIDLIPYLAKDSDGRIQRGKHVVSVTPNERARINAQLNTQFFIQSRGAYTL